MTTTYVKCTHTRGNRIQECVLVLTDDRMACLPIGPAQNAAAKIAGGIAMAAAGLVTIRLDTMVIEPRQLATVEQLDAAVRGAGGFYVGADWTYRTRVPVIGTMLKHGDEVLTTRERVPAPILAKLTPDRAPLSAKVVKIVCGIGAGILAIAAIVYLATGSLEALFGIGFWGVLIIGAALYAWIRVRR
jgi:hypothetical protein